ncbi:DUF1501 domain-containing protein [Limnoglobus roseus]|uniref:DUF1501 domain-containing protein n=1 Tax=Limnoglobus roseus TaxID=2598579 RepID=A0A5C1A651_9BACT|nr:DUF1501 domain-containing protein [Limnoglobus roseus]QEL13466.1 hypothetical protein PX52LOC_00323 [Limnoglobus roseus]
MPRLSASLGSLGAALTRRDVLRIGLPALLAANPVRAAKPRGGFGRAKSVLVVFASGGQSQFETYDPKPDAPEEIRGAFGSIPTTVPGLRFCEHLPKLAKLAHRVSVVKSVMHDDLDHGSAVYLSLTGRFHPRKSSNPDPSPNDYPALGAVLKRVRPAARLPYTAIHVNGPLLVPLRPSPGLNGGFLGHGFEPYTVGDPTDDGELTGGLEQLSDVSAARFQGRQQLLGNLDGTRYPSTADHATMVRQAYDVLKSPQARSAFDLSRESAAVRDRYGRHRSGQACLLARRLVEVGVPWVTTFFNYTIRGQDQHPDETEAYGWDTHNDIFDAMKTHLLPRWDATFAVLLDDLHQRGLLDTTLVVGMGEFGRAPKVALEPRFAGASPGRKHWAGCYSVVMAGAGVTPGSVYGASDRIGAYPSDRPVTPADLTATMFYALGLDPGGHYADSTNRPSIISEGTPITGLWA